MSQNLLVERLKSAKRELLALKTAHRRGLGLLKVYSEVYSIAAPSGSSTFYWLTIDLEFSVSTYPFVQYYIVNNDIASVPVNTAPEFEYQNGGTKAEFRIVLEKVPSGYRFGFSSTSPIVSMNYSWSTYA